ncbi:MAG: Uma2 family endonuclease [Xenococcaceae cyanobacterium]
MLLDLKGWTVPPGQRLLLKDVNWQEFEQILEELGENRSAKISYSKGTLEIMTPLPEHEKAKGLIGEFVRILLDELAIDCEPFGSTTFKSENMDRGVEPDESFYIQNQEVMRGRDRIDLTRDPPPDLAIEIDITSRTQFDNYERLGVPELWRYNGKRLQINVLQNGKYVESQVSPTFPTLPLVDKIPQMIQQSKRIGRSAAIKAFRTWIKEEIGKSNPQNDH